MGHIIIDILIATLSVIAGLIFIYKLYAVLVIGNRRYLLLTSIAGIIISLLTLEGILQTIDWVGRKNSSLTLPRTSTLTKYFDPNLGPRLNPNQTGWHIAQSGEYETMITTNSNGWHDVEHMMEKPDNTYRIVIVGDSFVESLQVPLSQTFYRQLESHLSDSTDFNIQVIALGLSDTGPAQQLRLIELLIKDYNPDLVVQMFLSANDVRNSSPFIDYNQSLPYYTLDENKNLTLIHPSISDKSESLIRHTFRNLKTTKLVNQAYYKYRVIKQSKSKDDYHIDLHVYDAVYTEPYISGWELTQKILYQTKLTVEEMEAKYILVTLANNEQINDNVWNFYLDNNPAMSLANLDRKKPEKVMSSFCLAKEITCLFMLDHFLEFREKNPDIFTHFQSDGHWNETGHRLANEFLHEQLLSHILTAKRKQ